MTEIIIAVDEQDQVTGTIDKLQAHAKGILHRAFSIFIFNTNGELLLQQRASGKYHSGEKWTNTCCSHPRMGEETEIAVHRRLIEEMGFDCTLKEKFNFRYREELENGLIENELDHVFFGISDFLPNPEPTEVMDFKYISMASLSEELNTNPEAYTVWLKICFERVWEEYKAELNDLHFK